MIAVIGEKPSVARDIARIFRASEKQDGYLSGNGYLVTWAFGHLVGLAMPEAYGIQSFRRESLPIIPDSFQLTPRQVKAEKRVQGRPRRIETAKGNQRGIRPVGQDYSRHRCRKRGRTYIQVHLPVYRMQQALCPFMDKQPYGQGNP